MPDTQHAYDSVFNVYAPIGIGVFAFVVALIVFAVVRRGGGESAPSSADRLELSVAALLACVVAFLVWLTYHYENPEDRVIASPAMRMSVTAAQWSWRFRYPDGRSVLAIGWNPPHVVLPVGEEIEFDGRSNDVIHGFWIPQLRFMRQFFPGYTTRFDLIFPHTGIYKGECSVYCGEFHSQMHFTIDVVSQARYRAWLSSGVLA